ncbi:MAG: molybdopterin molybdotransferase MoeA [Desulfobulbaceae bacterium]
MQAIKKPSETAQMISIEEALQIIRNNMPVPATCEYALDEAVDRILAEDVFAPEGSPRFTNSAMDGYAVRWEDVRNAAPETPVLLRVIGESRAGDPFQGAVGKGEAVRISTGAMVAVGTDTVIRVEDTREEGGGVRIFAVRSRGQDVRHEGEEFHKGDLLLKAGTRISAPQVALLAGVGIARVRAYRPCRVTVLATGSELVGTGDAIAPHQIRDSNMIMLRAAVREAGGEICSFQRLGDEAQATREAIGSADADIVLCTGGVSVGRHDHVKGAAEDMGYVPLFWRIRQKPGKPLYLAKKGRTLLFGLPGNPVSAFMCFAHYVRPVIAAINGLPFGWPTVSGEAGEEIANHGKRTNMIRVRLTWRPGGGFLITHSAKQGSHMLTSLTRADGYIILEPGAAVRKGERCNVYRFDYLREAV